MQRRSLGQAAIAAALATPALAQSGPIEISFWHGLPQPLGGILEGFAEEYNRSQTRYRIVSSFRGSYPETMVAAIAAFRAGTAPHIVQMFEVGTGTMMAAGRAIKPLHELLAETQVRIGEGANIDGNGRVAYGTLIGGCPSASRSTPTRLSSRPRRVSGTISATRRWLRRR